MSSPRKFGSGGFSLSPPSKPQKEFRGGSKIKLQTAQGNSQTASVQSIEEGETAREEEGE